MSSSLPDSSRTTGNLQPGGKLVRLGKGEGQLKHIICMMSENQAFLRMLGCYQEVYGPEFRGVNPEPKQRRFNEDLQGNRYYQSETTWRQPPIDPEHSLQDTAVQMTRHDMGDMLGFVANFHEHYPDSTPEERQNIMDFFPRGFLPATHFFADHGVIFDNWHASVPGPTWPNRWMHLAGTCNGYVNMGSPFKPKAFEHWFEKNNPTVLSQLAEAGVSFRAYYHDIPISWLLKRNRHPEVAQHYYQFNDQFFKDVAKPEAELPFLLYVEPCYQGPYQNDNHPPQDIMKGEYLLAQIYNAVRANEELWNSCAILFMYDEHGGFFDDMYPPSAVPPDSNAPEYACNQLGIRTPTILVSPLVPNGYDPTLYENTSFNRFLEDELGLPHLTARTQAANSFAHLFELLNEPRTDWPEKIQLTAEELEPPDRELDEKTSRQINHLNQAMLSLHDYLVLYELPAVLVHAARVYIKVKRWFRRAILRHADAHSHSLTGRLGVKSYQELTKKCDRYAQGSRRLMSGDPPRALKRFAKYSS